MIFGTFIGIVGLMILTSGLRGGRRQRPRIRMCYLLWGLLGVTYGVFRVADGFSRPLLAPRLQGNVMLVFTLVCAIALFVAILRKDHET